MKQYPSIDEATHFFNGIHYKVGEETCYIWSDNFNGWQTAAVSSERVKQKGTPLKTKQEAQEQTIDQPATTLPTPSGNSPSSASGEAAEAFDKARKDALDELTFLTEELGLYDLKGNPLVKPLTPSMTEKRDRMTQDVSPGSVATCDPTSPDNRQVGGDHYKRMKVQPWAALDDWLTSDQKVGYYLGSAVAYLARFNSEGVGKGGVQDVKKAKHYLEKLIDTLNKEKKEHE